MDATQFDRLTRMLIFSVSRRGSLAAVLAATLLRHDPDTVLAGGGKGKGKNRGKGKGKGKGKRRRNAPPPPPPSPADTACFTGANCVPGHGAANEDCDFASSTLFRNLDARGAVLSRANFANANAANADFRGAILDDACFVGAILLDARLDNSTVLGGAIFCNTRMPDGTIHNAGCDHPTACCPTSCEGEGCGPLGGAAPCDVCPSGCEFDSLAAAVAAAQPRNTIRICAGVFHTVAVSIAKSLTIIGAGSDEGGTTLDAQGGGQVLSIAAGADVLIVDLKVTGGSAALGGGIRNAGVLGLSGVSVTGNSAINVGSGGGIFNTGDLRLQSGSSVTGNDAANGGGIANTGTLALQNNSSVANNTAINAGGIFVVAGTVTLQSGSSVTGNTTNLNGGGILTNAGSTLMLQNGSSVAANKAALNGGGISNAGRLTLLPSSSVTGNTATNGGGIFNFAGTATLEESSRVMGNSANNDGGGVFVLGGTVTVADEDIVTDNIAGGIVNNCSPMGAVDGCVG